jgi:hypothetical protein
MAWFKNAHFQVTMRTLNVLAGAASRLGPASISGRWGYARTNRV